MQVQLSCDKCGEDVGDQGWVWVHKDDIRRVQDSQERNRGKGLITADDLELDLLGGAPWRVHHPACDDEPDAAHYWFGSDEIRTLPRLLEWCCHMGEKGWPNYETNWWQFVRSRVLEQVTE